MVTKKISTKNFHYLEADYSRQVFELDQSIAARIRNKLTDLYGERDVEEIFNELYRIIKVYYAHKTPDMIDWENNFNKSNRFSEQDVILITYGDLISSKEEKPLITLSKLCKLYLKGVFNTLHILPFYPYSSDRGFAILDFEEVDQHLGTWDVILDINSDFNLIFDGVLSTTLYHRNPAALHPEQ